VRAIRSSFAQRTVAGGVILVVALVLLASVAVVAIHRQQQVDQENDTAHTRAVLVGQLIDRVSVAEADASARDLSSRRQLADLLSTSGSTAQLSVLLADTRAPSGLGLYVVSSSGAVTAVPGSAAWPDTAEAMAAVQPALRGTDAGTPATVVSGGQLAEVVAVPVNGASGTAGAVAAVVPLAGQLRRFSGAVGYPIVLLTTGGGSSPILVATDGSTADASSLVGGLDTSAAEVQAMRSAFGSDVVLDLVRLPSPASGRTVAFVGVAVPLAGFLATEGSTVITVALLAVLAATVTSIAVLLVVDRWVRRPVAELERGVARITEGDYTTDIPVHSDDELGRLAGGVNSMAEQIAAAMQGTRAALSHLRWVSEALTAVDFGAAELSASVARAAAEIAGEGAGACLIRRQGNGSAIFEHGNPGDVSPERVAAEMGESGVATREAAGSTWRTSFPLAIDEGVITGRLVVSSAEMLGANEMAALSTLANYAGLALDHARLLEQEHETVRRLRAADAARAEFLSTTHHELRTPLSIVLGMAELAESSWDEVSDSARRRYLSGIVVGARRLARTIENVLTLTMLASDEVPLTRRPVALRPVVDTVVAQAVERWKSDGARRVTVSVAADLTVDADRDFLERMVDALVDNAMKFTRADGAVEVSAERDGATAVIRVRDDGVGVPAGALPHVFERFYQAEKGHARQFGGLGLGLTVAARVCALHGASIALASSDQHGAEATVRWPIAGGVAPRPADTAMPVV
jgi:signal transduction histidine kinase